MKEIPVKHEKQLKVEYGDDSSCLVTLRDVEIAPNSEIVISFGLRKIMIPFEDYPNDPNRGLNIPQMPVFYTLGSDPSVKKTMSQSMLLKNMEPDFSMPFNVNAVTNALIGLLFINTYNSLVKPKRLI